MIAIHTLLPQGPDRQQPAVAPFPGAPDIGLVQGRLHEAAGPARRTFACWLAARLTGPVFWIAPQWTRERPNAEGMYPWVDPARLVFVAPTRAEDLLWVMEEVLRSGASALAIADLPALPGLTAVRRMHLAAETGGRTGAHLPLGLLLTPGEGGAPGVETRWHLRPRHEVGTDRWQLDRLRARAAPPASWTVVRSGTTEALRIKTA
jgi:protein ImuA